MKRDLEMEKDASSVVPDEESEARSQESVEAGV